jgi:ADP-ribosylglycohydrolase
MRAAPAGMVGDELEPFAVGCDVAALTHGHPCGYLAGGALALMIKELVGGAELPAAITAVLVRLGIEADSAEVAEKLTEAVELAKSPPSVDRLELLGQGRVAEEALAIGVYAALQGLKSEPQEAFLTGVSLAVSHGGDSDSTGAIAGNILGAALGISRVPVDLLTGLEGREVIEQVARDMILHLYEPPEAVTPPAGWPEPIDLDRYPMY